MFFVMCATYIVPIPKRGNHLKTSYYLYLFRSRKVLDTFVFTSGNPESNLCLVICSPSSTGVPGSAYCQVTTQQQEKSLMDLPGKDHDVII